MSIYRFWSLVIYTPRTKLICLLLPISQNLIEIVVWSKIV